MTAPALPPEVDDAIVAAMKAATDFGVDGMLAHLQRTQDAVNALRTAILTAMRAACASSGAASDASSASARALGGDGEPVAWAVYSSDNILATCGPSRAGCENYAAGLNEPGWTAKKGSRPFRVVPLFARPGEPCAATDVGPSRFRPGDRVRVLRCEPPVYYFLRYRLGPTTTPPDWRGAWACAPTRHGSECVALHKEGEIELAATGGPDAR